MTQMPGTMSKGEVLERLDELLSDQVRREAVLEALKGSVALADLAERFGVASGEQVTHIRNDWFGDNWWPQAQKGVGAVEQIVRAGLITAIEQAKAENLPIDTYWICHPGPHGTGAHAATADDEHVEVACCWSEQQITLVFHTPEPPPLPHTRPEPIKIIVWEHGHPEMMDLSRPVDRLTT